MDEIEAIILSGGYLTPKQAAIYLGVKVKSLADYRSKNRKPEFIKRHNAIRYSPYAIVDFIKERKKTHKNESKYDYLLSVPIEHGSAVMHKIQESV